MSSKDTSIPKKAGLSEPSMRCNSLNKTKNNPSSHIFCDLISQKCVDIEKKFIEILNKFAAEITAPFKIIASTERSFVRNKFR